jgi:hypothetical protein
MPVHEMAKPAGEPCPHACTGKGCRIYDKRPDECRGFACEWILDARMSGDLKPDRCGFVVTVTPDRRVMNIIPSRTLSQGQWRRLVRLAEQVGEHSIVMVLVRDLAEGHHTYRQFISRKPKCVVAYMPDDAGRPFTIFFFSKKLYGRLARLASKDQLAALLSMGLESSKDLFFSPFGRGLS